MQDREKNINLVTICGAAANILLAIFKLTAGILGRSAAMTADAVHSFSDLVSDLVVLVMVRVSGKGSDKGHDYGHGKFETLATVIIAVLLLLVGFKLMAEGVEKIALALRGEELEVPGKIALWAAVISIAVKEFLYQWTARVGKRFNSPAVVANAWHHRSDALSSVGAAVGIGAALLLGGKWAVLDPVCCCIISVIILSVSIKMMIPAAKELTEASLSDADEAEIVNVIKSVNGVQDVHALKTRKTGPDIVIDSHIVVDPDMTVAEAHRITIEAENGLRERFGAGTQISIHVEPDVESE